ncbi:FAD-binding oxidoreductase [Maritimibacter alkaliphilus]|uniref:FAD-binding oxidoreductase n=1 Tax=Maritimibacter alkaliphilus TaxID=404236 RepID=UPI001C940AA8|nr:FAD-binding oxidoreductase [Maritimibacter alkaliphilus]MBY6092841.1 FAD-binding oxidoreductase [Maritimibacter alkaliphilus]
MIDRLAAIVGPNHVLTGAAAEPWAEDWTGAQRAEPLAVVRAGSTEEVAAVVKLANETGTPVVPIAGRTGLAGGGLGEGAILLSVERMTAIRAIRPDARIAVVEAGVILEDLHGAVEDLGLSFPLFFGARGSARIGGALATNAGGSNVLRYGNTRDLVLGIEAVLPTGEVVDLMHELHKNNSGYDLRHLLIGSEGTLGVITAAVVKLVPKPRAHVTAMVGMAEIADTLPMLNRLREATGGAVEAFEFMPDDYVTAYLERFPEVRAPFEDSWPVNVLIELGAVAERDATPGPDGEIPMRALLEEVLAAEMEAGHVGDAVIAANESQRRGLWAMREAAAEMATSYGPVVVLDVAVPLDRVEEFLARADVARRALDPTSRTSIVAHLGDGNVHYSVIGGEMDKKELDAVTEAVEEIVLDLGGSFSAEHGIGTFKLSSMARRKDAAALMAMRAIKAALDPANILNPGKLLPPA